ncbi:acyltransferase [Hymenobacter sp. 5317J-9]|uniref:acyltransferase family protein n=1 Tax=Hymenobacter sp. 5317J-9 TaxID=2932250 RepID=UPI001FD6A77F|nr:acyltransferase [Hymenobacter sp. 5317J-9]UOQ96626.1 acyltransferase [Hymenobacter sp. 5317J-9]
MEPEPHKAPIRFYEIDLLRFLAALSVVFYHYTFWGYTVHQTNPLGFPELAPATKYGYLGVELFFIISGYVVLLSAQGKTVTQFLRSRITRLYPAFWAAVTFTFLVVRFGGAGLNQPLLTVGAGQYIYNLTMLHEFFGVAAVDASYWSLTVEITFYFLVSLLIGYKLMRHLDLFMSGWLACIVLSMAAAKLGAESQLAGFTYLFFPKYAPYFIAGMLFYLFQAPAGRTWLRFGLLAAAYALALRSGINQGKELTAAFNTPFSNLVIGGAITLFFGIFLLISFRVFSLSRFAWLKWAGALTYPLYLLHQAAGYVIFNRLAGLANNYVLLAGVIAFMLAAAAALHVFIEKPASKWLGKRLSVWMARFDSETPGAAVPAFKAVEV